MEAIRKKITDFNKDLHAQFLQWKDKMLLIQDQKQKLLFLPEKKDIFEPDIPVMTISDLDQHYKEELLENLKESRIPVVRDQLLQCNPLMPQVLKYFKEYNKQLKEIVKKEDLELFRLLKILIQQEICRMVYTLFIELDKVKDSVTKKSLFSLIVDWNEEKNLYYCKNLGNRPTNMGFLDKLRLEGLNQEMKEMPIEKLDSKFGSKRLNLEVQRKIELRHRKNFSMTQHSGFRTNASTRMTKDDANIGRTSKIVNIEDHHLGNELGDTNTTLDLNNSRDAISSNHNQQKFKLRQKISRSQLNRTQPVESRVGYGKECFQTSYIENKAVYPTLVNEKDLAKDIQELEDQQRQPYDSGYMLAKKQIQQRPQKISSSNLNEHSESQDLISPKLNRKESEFEDKLETTILPKINLSNSRGQHKAVKTNEQAQIVNLLSEEENDIGYQRRQSLYKLQSTKPSSSSNNQQNPYLFKGTGQKEAKANHISELFTKMMMVKGSMPQSAPVKPQKDDQSEYGFYTRMEREQYYQKEKQLEQMTEALVKDLKSMYKFEEESELDIFKNIINQKERIKYVKEKLEQILKEKPLKEVIKQQHSPQKLIEKSIFLQESRASSPVPKSPVNRKNKSSIASQRFSSHSPSHLLKTRKEESMILTKEKEEKCYLAKVPLVPPHFFKKTERELFLSQRQKAQGKLEDSLVEVAKTSFVKKGRDLMPYSLRPLELQQSERQEMDSLQQHLAKQNIRIPAQVLSKAFVMDDMFTPEQYPTSKSYLMENPFKYSGYRKKRKKKAAK